MVARLAVKIRPRAKCSAIAGVMADVVKINIAAPPEDGKANAELIRFLAEQTGLRRSQIEIVLGNTSPNKIVEFNGISYVHLLERLQ